MSTFPALSKANASSKKYTDNEFTLFAKVWRITAYKKPKGAVIKNQIKAMQKSKKLLNKDIWSNGFIQYFFRKFSKRKNKNISVVPVWLKLLRILSIKGF